MSNIPELFNFRTDLRKHNQRTSGEFELLSKDRRSVGFGSSQLGLRDASIREGVYMVCVCGGGQAWGGGGGQAWEEGWLVSSDGV